jgi:hypothetical protein
MPTPKQMEKLAAEAVRQRTLPAAAPDGPLPTEYWDSLLRDPRAGANRYVGNLAPMPGVFRRIRELDRFAKKTPVPVERDAFNRYSSLPAAARRCKDADQTIKCRRLTPKVPDDPPYLIEQAQRSGIAIPPITPHSLDISQGRKVFSIRWNDAGLVEIVRFQRGEWESLLNHRVVAI